MRIWRFLNSPLIAALIAVVVMLVVTWFGLRPLVAISRMFDTNDMQRVDTLAHLQLLSFKEIPTSADQAQKFVGRIRNNSDQLVTGITGAVSFYDDDKLLKDLFTQRLDAVSLLKPQQEADFVMVRSSERDASGGGLVKTSASHIELRFVDVNVSHDIPK
jgi:hypothetical protein